MTFAHTAWPFFIFFWAGSCLVHVASLAPPKGSAARPLDKKKIVVLGGGGAMGGLTFGFVQRACSLYGTGLGDYRTLGACSDTAARLNLSLSKSFCLGFANEANIKLTNLKSVDAIASRLSGWADALIFGTDMATQKRSVTSGSYEKTPNDKCDEVYWKAPSTFIRDDKVEDPIVSDIIENVLSAAKEARLKHIVFVDESNSDRYVEMVEKTGIPYTRIQPVGELVSFPGYTFRNGVQGNLVINASGSDSTAASYDGRCYLEDVSALCVQSLLSLDWSLSRTLSVSTSGPASSLVTGPKNPKRPDQEWCVNSFLLEQALAGIR